MLPPLYQMIKDDLRVLNLPASCKIKADFFFKTHLCALCDLFEHYIT